MDDRTVEPDASAVVPHDPWKNVEPSSAGVFTPALNRVRGAKAAMARTFSPPVRTAPARLGD